MKGTSLADRDSVYVFKASLVGFRGVTRTIAIRSGQTLDDLHKALQWAFDWDDDHLYSFWLSGKFSDGVVTEYTSPVAAERGYRSALVRLDRLGLVKGQKIAYVFDFGDEWRVRLTLSAIRPVDDAYYPQIVASRGKSPPQYGYEDEEELAEAG